jgi:hypothetical protein
MSKETTTATEVATEITLDNKIILKGLEDCARIICINNDNPYKSGKRKEAGKTYSLFRLGTIVFNVANDSPFVADHKEGILTKVELNKTLVDKKSIDDEGNEIVEKVSGLELDYHLTNKQTNSFKDQSIIDDEFELKLARIAFKREAFKNLSSQPITDEFLAQLLNQ